MSQVNSASMYLAATLCALIWASTTYAETESPQATAEAVQTETAAQAKQLWDWYGEASDLHDEGKLSEAWVLYQRVWKHRKTYDVATSLGDVCFQRGEFALAAHYYRIALDGMVPTQSPKFVQNVEETYDKARAEVAELKVSVKPVGGKSVEGLTITDVSSNVVLEEPIYLEAGDRLLQASAPGYKPVKFEVLAKPGSTVEWKIEFEPDTKKQTSQSEPEELPPAVERLTTVRHPWIVFPIGGVVTAGLAYGAWYNARRGVEAYDLSAGLGLIPGDCDGATPNAICEQATKLSRQARGADTRAWLFGGGAVLTAAATGIVYWLWETEVPVSVSFEPSVNYGEMRWNYAF